MEIRLEKSLILCASHRLRVRPSYLGEKREGNRQKGERGDKRERGAETDGQQARGGNGVDRWKKVKSGVCRRAASRQKWRWERASDREMREGKQIYCLWSSYLKGTVHPKIRNNFHLICSRRLLEIIGSGDVSLFLNVIVLVAKKSTCPSAHDAGQLCSTWAEIYASFWVTKLLAVFSSVVRKQPRNMNCRAQHVSLTNKVKITFTQLLESWTFRLGNF